MTIASNPAMPAPPAATAAGADPADGAARADGANPAAGAARADGADPAHAGRLARPGQALVVPAPRTGGQPAGNGAEAAAKSESESESESESVERALAAVRDADCIGDLLDALRAARLWLPLPGDGTPAITGSAVTLPTVSYLGCDFVPAYSSAELLCELAPATLTPHSPEPRAEIARGRPGTGRPAPGRARDADPGQLEQPAETIRYLAVPAADLARLLPPTVGIALNAGAPQSVPVYPQGVSYLAADSGGSELARMTVTPLPVRPDGLLADIAAGLMQIPAVRDASAAWLSVQFAGEGLLISVTLDDPADASAQDIVAGAIERAAWQAAPQDAGFALDVTFPGERPPDQLDDSIAAAATQFYRR